MYYYFKEKNKLQYREIISLNMALVHFYKGDVRSSYRGARTRCAAHLVKHPQWRIGKPSSTCTQGRKEVGAITMMKIVPIWTIQPTNVMLLSGRL